MALTVNHPTLKETFQTVYCPSIGGTPVAAYVRVPFRAKVGKVGVIAQGAITTADCTVTVAVNGTTNTALAGTLPLTGAAAGQVATWSPTTNVYVNEDDYITFTPSGASGASIAGVFTINFIVA